MRRAKQAGVRFVNISPFQGDTEAELDAEWIPIRPGTDTAMMLGMAHVLIDSHRYDEGYLERCTTGFGRLRDYIMGDAPGPDGVATPTTPEWAERITGVPHASGREGCRLAHLRALARAYALNERYVLITEDDVVPSSSDGSLQTCLSEFHRQVAKLDAARAPVLLLLECGHGLERRISLKECRGGPHFRRILGGGNNTGAYLVRRDFIPALQLLWRAAWGMHIDGTWQYLWPFFEVWMAFPPPLKQRQARSNVVTGVRAECRAFDIDMYYAANRFL
jgi:hypothetical protein